jgi:inosine-uridine nucleoside N-ribohydrolase
MEPKIAEKDVTVIWIGGRDWPAGGWEYNLCSDIHAANAVFKSDVTLWQVPRNVYRMMPVSFMELYDKVYSCKKLGQYLVDNVIAFNNAV